MRAVARVGIPVAAVAALGLVLLLTTDAGEPGAPTRASIEGERTEAAGESAPDVARARRRRLQRITVAASGDILIHSPVYQRALLNGGGSSYDFSPMLAPLRPWIREADIALCHIETVMAASLPLSGYPRFNAPPSLGTAIGATGFDACSVASNHSADQGHVGIEETLGALDRADVAHAGTYASAPASRRTLLIRHRKARVALLSYTTDLNGLESPSPWSVNLVEDPRTVLADARRARADGADAVIVNMHWSSGVVPEYTHAPSADQREFAARLARSPAITAIVGQGPHVVQPIERINGKYVVFSEGNLISNQGAASGLPAASQDGLIAFLEMVVGRDRARVLRVRYLPVWVRRLDYAVLPATGRIADGARARVVSVVGRGNGVAPVNRRTRSRGSTRPRS
jgi:poly-gamma-glutamate capsule biosynthesis protein CapA/YwtB (metallophosphatase superfamily)